MQPQLEEGDVVLYDSEVSSFKRGDIVVVSTFVHRVALWSRTTVFWHCGDKPGSQLILGRAPQVRGRVIGAYRDNDWLELRPKFIPYPVIARNLLKEFVFAMPGVRKWRAGQRGVTSS